MLMPSLQSGDFKCKSSSVHLSISYLCMVVVVRAQMRFHLHCSFVLFPAGLHSNSTGFIHHKPVIKTNVIMPPRCLSVLTHPNTPSTGYNLNR